MSVIRYRDSEGNVKTVVAVKGDRGPMGPKGVIGDTGPMGPTGPRGGTSVIGSVPKKESLSNKLLYATPIGQGYIVENTGELYIAGYELDEAGNPTEYRSWIKSSDFIPVALGDLNDVFIDIDAGVKGGQVLMFDSEEMVWTNKDFGISEGMLSTTEDITVTLDGDNLGALADLTKIPQGTTFNDFVKMISVKIIKPKYTSPSLVFSSSVNSAEIGTIINPKLTINYNNGDAGVIKGMKVYKNDTLISDTVDIISSITIPGYEVEKDDVYKVIISYGEGIIKSDSAGNPYPIGHIMAGSIEKSLTIKSQFGYWGYSNNVADPPDDISIRSTKVSGIGLSKGKTITVNCKATDRTVIFAYPRDLGECSSIEYVGFDTHNEDSFTKVILQICDINGNNYIDYLIYYYTAPIAMSTCPTFILTV